MRNVATLAVGIFLILVQSHVYRMIVVLDAILPPSVAIHLHGVEPNLVLPLIIFLGVHEQSMARGALLAFALGYATDILASAPIGLFSFIYVAIWWLARLAGVRLTAQTLLPRMSLAFAFAIVEGIFVLVLLAVFGADTKRPIEILPMIVPRSLSTALFAPLVLRLAQRLHQGPTPVRTGAQSVEGAP
jgi:rod shape-determining protein MreD